MGKVYNIKKHSDLIYDVGMHKGEDTLYYLKKGFSVIAFEANPELIAYCKRNLKNYINQNKLIIIEGAIVDNESEIASHSTIPFYTFEDKTDWGTIRQDWKNRNINLGKNVNTLEVNTINFVSIMKKYGVPHYLKIDIEGVDLVCLKALKHFKERPNYVSIESDKTSFKNIIREINILCNLGYDRFKAIEQSTIYTRQKPPKPPKEGKYVSYKFGIWSSGLFGAELEGRWKTKPVILRQYFAIMFGYFLFGDNGKAHKWKFRGGKRLRKLALRFCRYLTKSEVPGWYDTHARHNSVNT